MTKWNLIIVCCVCNASKYYERVCGFKKTKEEDTLALCCRVFFYFICAQSDFICMYRTHRLAYLFYLFFKTEGFEIIQNYLYVVYIHKNPVCFFLSYACGFIKLHNIFSLRLSIYTIFFWLRLVRVIVFVQHKMLFIMKKTQYIIVSML